MVSGHYCLELQQFGQRIVSLQNGKGKGDPSHSSSVLGAAHEQALSCVAYPNCSSVWVSDASVALALFGIVAVISGTQDLLSIVSAWPPMVPLNDVAPSWNAALAQTELCQSSAWFSSFKSVRLTSGCSSDQFLVFNGASIVLDVLRLAIASDIPAFGLLVIVQLLGMAAKVRTASRCRSQESVSQACHTWHAEPMQLCTLPLQSRPKSWSALAFEQQRRLP